MAHDEDPVEIEGSHYILWVEGRRVVRTWDDEGRVHADRLTQAAGALGLHVFRRKVTENTDPDLSPVRRSWTHRRIGSDDVLGLVTKLPGIKFDDIIMKLYQEPPWTGVKRSAAIGKARVALHRLKARGLVIKVYDENGVERWQVPGVKLKLRTSGAGSVAPLREEVGLPTPVLTADQILAGVAILRRVGIYSENSLVYDPNIYEDLVLSVWGALTGA